MKDQLGETYQRTIYTLSTIDNTNNEFAYRLWEVVKLCTSKKQVWEYLETLKGTFYAHDKPIENYHQLAMYLGIDVTLTNSNGEPLVIQIFKI